MKLTTKVLLGATLVAGLTTSAFAACAADVDMGAKKLTNVADGTVAGDAVNVGQVLTVTQVDIAETNSSKWTEFSSSFPLKAIKVGRTVCLNGLWKNVSGSTLTAFSGTLGNVPVGYRPLFIAHEGDSSKLVRLSVSVNGNISVYSGLSGASVAVNGNISNHICYISAN